METRTCRTCYEENVANGFEHITMLTIVFDASLLSDLISMLIYQCVWCFWLLCASRRVLSLAVLNFVWILKQDRRSFSV